MRLFWCFVFLLVPILAVLSCIYAEDYGLWFPGEAETLLGKQIDDLFYLINIIVTVTFIGTNVGLCYAIWRASRNQEDGVKAWYTHGVHSLEVIWSIVPACILMFISLFQLDVWMQFRVRSNYPEQAKKAPVAEVTARQFEWRIRYPAPGKVLQIQPQPDDIYTVNDLHVPVNQPVMIQLRTQDVQHSFFVPDLRVKQDAIPGQVIPIWFNVLHNGEYPLTCAELCGWGHYKMRGQVVAEPVEDFQAYLKKLQAEQNFDGVSKPETPELAQSGEE